MSASATQGSHNEQRNTTSGRQQKAVLTSVYTRIRTSKAIGLKQL